MILDVVSPIFVFSVEAIMILIPLLIVFIILTLVKYNAVTNAKTEI